MSFQSEELRRRADAVNTVVEARIRNRLRRWLRLNKLAVYDSAKDLNDFIMGLHYMDKEELIEAVDQFGGSGVIMAEEIRKEAVEAFIEKYGIGDWYEKETHGGTADCQDQTGDQEVRRS